MQYSTVLRLFTRIHPSFNEIYVFIAHERKRCACFEGYQETSVLFKMALRQVLVCMILNHSPTPRYTDTIIPIIHHHTPQKNTLNLPFNPGTSKRRPPTL